MANLLIVGLGNIGLQYKLNRHNVGFIVLDYIASHFNLSFNEKFKGLTSKVTIKGVECIFLKPSTLMNRSGASVLDCANFYKIPLDDIIIVHDDIDLPFLNIRHKVNSGSGGQNGIKDIINVFGSNAFHRIKFGVGKPENSNIPIADYVLSNFTKDELLYVEEKSKLFIDNIDLLVNKNFTSFIKNLTTN